MFTNQSQLLSKVHQSLTNLSETHLIIKENTENWEKNQNVILGVDAASVNPAVTIFNDQSIKGLVNNYESKDKFFTQGSVTLQLFEEWLKNNSKLMVNSMFLFNIQPLNPNLNSFIIHIHPSNCGKGEKLIIQILNNLKDQLKKFDINTVAFAADGDSIFRPMHVQNINDHIINSIFYTSISSSQTLIISDLLHLLKRARYHLVPDIFDTNQFISLLNLPSMTMRKDRASKMHDRLPLLLFQMQNYEILSQNNLFNYSLFILPFSLLLSSLSYEVSYENRVLLFHLSRRLFHFIYFSPNNFFYKDQIKYKPQILSDSLSILI